MSNKVELLSPAGDMEGFYGAIHAGADAVYLSGKQFGARAYADNFSEEEILEAIRYAHLFGKKVYLTVNTLVKEFEMDKLFLFLKPLYEAGLDAVIVQDFGVLHFIRENFPHLDIHASTQMTITGKFGCEVLLEQGASRVVPARELSLSEIAEIKKTVPVELECFIHGAMCYCYSGQCLFSSFLGERSGNRGRCAQPCRLPYGIDGKNELYPLSLKDMNTLEYIPQLIEAGIDSFKIEGRMKKPEYTAGITSVYRKYIDQYYKKQWAGVSARDRELLANLYTRSETESGYYFRHNGKEMVTLSKPSYNENDIKVLNEIKGRYLSGKKKLPISMQAEFKTGHPCQMVLSFDGHSVTVFGEEVLPAKNRPLSEEEITKQLKKLGDSPFMLQSFSVSADNNIFLPVKSINELRRNGLNALWREIIEANGFQAGRVAHSEPIWNDLESMGEEKPQVLSETYHVSLQTVEQLRALKEVLAQFSLPVQRIYISTSLLNDYEQEVIDLASQIAGKTLWIALPYITRKENLADLERVYVFYSVHSDLFGGFLIRNQEQYGFFKDKLPVHFLALDHNMYIWNRECAAFWKNKVSGYCLPLELKWDEQKDLFSKTKDVYFVEKMIYGYVPMMQSANCILRTTHTCQQGKPKKKDYIILKDRYQKEFFVYLNCRECYNTIYNTVPLSLHKEIGRWSDKAALRLDFTLETKKQTEEILLYFMTQHRNDKLPYHDYTTGHENRGVE